MMIETLLPILHQKNGDLTTVVLGDAAFAIGEQVEVKDSRGRVLQQKKYVTEIMECNADELQDDYLSDLGYIDTDELVQSLTRAYKTGLPRNVRITLYTLGDTYEVEEEDEDDLLAWTDKLEKDEVEDAKDQKRKWWD